MLELKLIERIHFKCVGDPKYLHLSLIYLYSKQYWFVALIVGW